MRDTRIHGYKTHVENDMNLAWAYKIRSKFQFQLEDIECCSLVPSTHTTRKTEGKGDILRLINSSDVKNNSFGINNKTKQNICSLTELIGVVAAA